MDKIILKQMQFYGYHGLFSEEQKLGQRFQVDVELHTSLQKAGTTDNMNDSIDYGKAFKVVQAIVEGKSFHLIEAIAEQISISLFENFPTLQGCVIQVTKPDPPIEGHYESVAVKIYRERNK